MENYNWKITNLYTLNTATETDYVVNALYTVTGTETSEGVEYTASVDSSAQFNITEGSTFIPYSDLTNDLVVEWIKSDLGESKVNNIEGSIYFAIQDKITPPVSPEDTPLPPNFG